MPDTEAISSSPAGTSRIAAAAAGAAVLAGLYLSSLYSYLLFHSLVEIFTVTIAAGIFMIAWKYTSRRDGACIEFSSTQLDGRHAWFVRDNGLGFHMSDAAQLFQPFKRLASSADLPGHGIGLATVRRIVERHGGSVWGEGEPGKGATFYFTI